MTGLLAAPLNAQIILCDAAQSDSATGKVHMLGAGWSTTGTPTQHAVVVLIKVPWDLANQKLPLQLVLRDADGRPVAFETPGGLSEVRGNGEIEVGRPIGLVPGSMLDASFALNVAPLPLPPGRYEWHLTLADLQSGATFTVRG